MKMEKEINNEKLNKENEFTRNQNILNINIRIDMNIMKLINYHIKKL